MEAVGAQDLGHGEIMDHSTADIAKPLDVWKMHE